MAKIQHNKSNYWLNTKPLASVISQNPLIDSYGILIREDQLIEIDYKVITSPILYYENTGEFIETLPVQPQKFINNGITLRFNRVHLNDSPNFKGGYFIKLVITSKMLEYHYFNGLNISNIEQITNYINSSDIIKLTSSTLLNSVVNDIDICRNYYSSANTYRDNLDSLYKSVIDSKKNFVSKFTPKRTDTEIEYQNIGLIFGENRVQGNYKNPFIKFYNKIGELKTKSSEFYNYYLLPQVENNKLELTNLRRVEITIKNSAHKVSLVKANIIPKNGLRSLNDLYMLSNDQMNTLFDAHLYKYFDRSIRLKKDSSLNPMDSMIAYFIKLNIKNGVSYEELENVKSLGLTKQQRYDYSKRFKHIYKTITSTNYIIEICDKNREFHSFIDWLHLSEIMGVKILPEK